MTIITSEAELEEKLKRARLDIAHGRVHTWEEIMKKVEIKMNNKKLCIK